jgi:hypothetical protein
VPVATALTVKVVPEIVAVNLAPTAVEFKARLELVCETLMVYVPTPPEPLPKAVITVSAATPTPYKDCPIAIVPLDIEVTVKVVPEVEPVNTALAGEDIRHV